MLLQILKHAKYHPSHIQGRKYSNLKDVRQWAGCKLEEDLLGKLPGYQEGLHYFRHHQWQSKYSAKFLKQQKEVLFLDTW